MEKIPVEHRNPIVSCVRLSEIEIHMATKNVPSEVESKEYYIEKYNHVRGEIKMYKCISEPMAEVLRRKLQSSRKPP